MARQRMYLCEGAYRDYVLRLEWLSEKLKSACFGVWNWCWSGPLASGCRVITFFSVIAIGILFTALLLVHDLQQPQGLALSSLISTAVVFAFVLAALLAWLPMANGLARALTGVTGGVLVMIAASGPFAAGVVVMIVYILALIVLTGVTGIVALPARLSQELWLLYRRITYSCPYGCGYRGLPIHVAKTGEWVRDLLPSTYGIFYHQLLDDNETIKLPTLDILGRNRLERLCGGCENPLVHSSFGELTERPIAVIGGPGVGKTVFLRQAIRAFIRRVKQIPRGAARIDSEKQAAELQKDFDDLDRGLVMAKTAGGLSHAFGVSYSIPKCGKALMHLFDAPGEDFARMERFGRKQVVRHLSGILLLVDPFALPAFDDRRDDLNPNLLPSSTTLYNISTVLIKGLDQLLLERPDRKCDVPLAVVMAKADAYPGAVFPCLEGLLPGGGQDPEALSARCRSALEQLGEGRSVRALEQKFTRVRYFACSALGRMPRPGDSSPFFPSGVTEPFFWLLKFDGR